MRKLRKVFDLIRGLCLSLCVRLFRLRRVKIGKMLFASRGAEFRVGDKGRARIGKRVALGKNALVSVLKNGELELGNGVSLNTGNSIICHEKIKIGNDTIFGPNVFVYDHDHVFCADTGADKRNYKTSPVEIGKNCWIGANTVILRGTKIGDNCVIGAGCVIKGEYPNGSLIVQKRETTVKEIR